MKRKGPSPTPATPDFPAWRHRFAALKRHLAPLRAYSLNQLEALWDRLLPGPLLRATDKGANSRDRVFSLRLTFWSFLWQTLNPGAACREVVREVQALFALQGRPRPDEDDSAYCQARARLPEATLPPLLTATAAQADHRAQGWRWLGRPVKVVDGTGLTLADTPANQKKHPQSRSQKPGCGFPLLKLVVFMSLASGAILAVVQGNKHQSELGLFRRLWDGRCAGDLVLGDDTYSDYATLAGLRARQADGVFRQQGRRGKDFRRGQRLGRYDRRITRHKPRPRPGTVSPRVWAQLPEAIQVRLIRFPVGVPGFRTRHIDLVTTLLDPRKYPATELAALFRRRWRLELCLRDLKTTLGMEHLRCKSPEMAHKELWMYLIAYNLIRCVMVEAAGAYAVEPERISFKGALDTVRHYSTALAQARNEKQRQNQHPLPPVRTKNLILVPFRTVPPYLS